MRVTALTHRHRRTAFADLPDEADAREEEAALDDYCEYELWQYRISYQDWLEFWFADEDLAV